MAAMPPSNPSESPPAIPGLIRNWTFQPSPVRWSERLRTANRVLRHGGRAPASATLKPASPAARWMVYFVYAPDVELTAGQRFTLERLRALALPVLVVCACPRDAAVLQVLRGLCDALLWKDLPGYDFSAYRLALSHLAARSPGADVLVMNDSVYGPFSDLREVFDTAPWALAGFTASNQRAAHIQSYAFLLRDVRPAMLLRLAPVLLPGVAFNQFRHVVDLQEARFARVAARSMSVGALWFGDVQDVSDPPLARPMELLDAGFPFLKRSLLGKHQGLIERDAVLARLEALGHPLPVSAAEPA
ncbi:rhamnan synthesis F family protein [Roseateles sp. BYS78W]|uniref:Rhamnan synthesis F family protein n=1 Tax=Pelomonas candidula TaxID=3299025 RepID=A0ABW7H5A9_9BURK